MLNIVKIISAYFPFASVSETLAMAAEIERVTTPVVASEPVNLNMSRSTLVTWLHGYDLSMNNGTRGYVNAHKIASIKALREAFGINGIVPSLRDSKDAVDRYLATIGYTAF